MKGHERYFFERLEGIDERGNHETPNDSNKGGRYIYRLEYTIS